MNTNISRILAAGLLGLVAMTAGGYASAEPSAESAVKAAVVHKISKFVSWPDNAFAQARSPIRFCVVGRGEMHDALLQFGDRPVQGHPVQILQPRDPVEVKDSCDVLYLGAGDGNAADWLRQAAERPILTFGEQGMNGADECIVTIAIRRNKVRFAINKDASDHAGLSISSQLLQLAVGLGDGGDGE